MKYLIILLFATTASALDVSVQLQYNQGGYHHSTFQSCYPPLRPYNGNINAYWYEYKQRTCQTVYVQQPQVYYQPVVQPVYIQQPQVVQLEPQKPRVFNIGDTVILNVSGQVAEITAVKYVRTPEGLLDVWFTLKLRTDNRGTYSLLDASIRDISPAP